MPWLGIWNDGNNTHPPEFTIVDQQFWLDVVVVVVAKNEPSSGSHHGAELIDSIAMSSDASSSCHCNHCHKNEPTSMSTTTVQLANACPLNWTRA
jgi:hypothetical protein